MIDTRFCGRPGGHDFAVPGEIPSGALERHGIPTDRWTWLHQLHGAAVVTVTEPGEWAGAEADAAVTATPGAVLCVRTADCAPVVLSSADGVLGVAHAGWRGLAAGVVDATVEAMREVGATGLLTAWVGPHIRARCYEFGPEDLDVAAAALGDRVRSTTAWGTSALDVTAGLAEVASRLGVALSVAPGCTACEPEAFFSHRARADTGRHATVAWLS